MIFSIVLHWPSLRRESFCVARVGSLPHLSSSSVTSYQPGYSRKVDKIHVLIATFLFSMTTALPEVHGVYEMLSHRPAVSDPSQH